VLSNASAMSQTSTLDVEANTSADNARTDTLCENANVLAHRTRMLCYLMRVRLRTPLM
jgi:hypothetical protein